MAGKFKVLEDPDQEAMDEAEQDASKNYAAVSNARAAADRESKASLEDTLAKPLVLPSEPNLDIAHSSPGVRQLPPDISPDQPNLDKSLSSPGVRQLSPEEMEDLKNNPPSAEAVRALLRQQMRG